MGGCLVDSTSQSNPLNGTVLGYRNVILVHYSSCYKTVMYPVLQQVNVKIIVTTYFGQVKCAVVAFVK